MSTFIVSAAEEQELVNRLKSQFGDLDLSQILGSQDNDSDDSSVEDPSPEELKAWQEEQFRKGQAILAEKRKQETKSALQRRRAELRKEKDEDDWEQVAALPDLQGQPSTFFPTCDGQGNEILGVHPLLQQLSEGDSEILGTAWVRLYSSAEGDGLSFYKLLETLRGYPGPTVMLIGAVPSSTKKMGVSSSTKTTIGFYTTSPWVESTQFTGSSECLLFSMDDNQVHFFRPRNLKPNEKEPHYMYCHPSTLNINGRRRAQKPNSTDGLVHGLGVGGTPLQPRLHLTETLEECRAMDYCRLFEEGDLLLGTAKDSLNYFDVDCLEVWAVGGMDWISESLQVRQAYRAVSDAATVKARKVDKQQFMQDLQGGILSYKTNGIFSHAQYVTERCDV